MWQRPWIAHERLSASAIGEPQQRAGLLRELAQAMGPAGVTGISLQMSPSWEAASIHSSGANALPIATLRVRLDVGLAQPPTGDSAGSTGVPESLLNWLREPVLPEVAVAAGAGVTPIVELELGSSQQSDRPSAPRADVRAAMLIRQVLDAAANGGARVSLLPRAENWLASVEDSVRLGIRINRAALGLSFSVLDWLRSDGRDLNSSLQLALPRMVNLIVTGCRRDDLGQWRAVPIEQSEFDLSHLLRESARLGYTGAVTWVPVCEIGSFNQNTSLHLMTDSRATLAAQWAAWQELVRKARAPRR